jgi:hypothetical protein
VVTGMLSAGGDRGSWPGGSSNSHDEQRSPQVRNTMASIPFYSKESEAIFLPPAPAVTRRRGFPGRNS